MLLQYPYKEKEKKSSQLIGRDRTLVFSLAWQVEHEN
jgi:tetrahydromethanopterin S-methyltransferase subunit F